MVLDYQIYSAYKKKKKKKENIAKNNQDQKLQGWQNVYKYY